MPLQFKLGPVTALSAGLAMLPRVGKGARYRKARMPKEPLTLWGYEASPFVKLAREVLVLCLRCKLHHLHTLTVDRPLVPSPSMRPARSSTTHVCRLRVPCQSCLQAKSLLSGRLCFKRWVHTMPPFIAAIVQRLQVAQGDIAAVPVGAE